MSWWEILIVAVVAVAFAAALGYVIYRKVTHKGGCDGCDCGGSCGSCPHCKNINTDKKNVR